MFVIGARKTNVSFGAACFSFAHNKEPPQDKLEAVIIN